MKMSELNLKILAKKKIRFPDIDLDMFVSGGKKGILIDIDNTLYPYWPNHIKSLKEVLKELRKLYPKLFGSFSLDDMSSMYQKHRRIILDRLEPLGTCRSRYYLFLSCFESYGITYPHLLALKMDKLYWSSFISYMEIDKKAYSFLKKMKEMHIPIVAVTDMQADVQIKKMKKLKIERLITYLVTSDEVGEEKPCEKIFKACLNKLKLKAEEVIMIGDNESKDIEGARRLGIDGYKVEEI